MPRLRAQEEWARQMLEAALGLTVSQHDDGSRSAMHDLDIALRDGTLAAVEVTAAADGECIALWNLVNKGDQRWQVPGLSGGWFVELAPSARAKLLLRELPDLLRELERRSVTRLDLDADYGRYHLTDVERTARRLGVNHVGQAATDFAGSIYVTIELPLERAGGIVSSTAQPLADWVATFLRQRGCADVRAKLLHSGAQERHAFVLVPAFTVAPFAVVDLLVRAHAPLPTSPPELSHEVTHVWIASTWSSGRGVRWSPDMGWAAFEKDVDDRPAATA